MRNADTWAMEMWREKTEEQLLGIIKNIDLAYTTEEVNAIHRVYVRMYGHEPRK